jgi:hypothetical protein
MGLPVETWRHERAKWDLLTGGVGRGTTQRDPYRHLTVRGVDPSLRSETTATLGTDMSKGTTKIRRGVWIAMLLGIGLEFALGIVSLVLVPTGRPDQWIPAKGEDVYLAHAVIGGLLGTAALLLAIAALQEGRIVRIAAVVGLVGLLLGAGGGMLTVLHPWRLAGMALMFAGTFIALFGFLVALSEQIPRGQPEGEGEVAAD